jgi:DNA-binding beta-propeller fold protein YncE
MRALLAVLILAAAGCSDRERANPFDPRNPRTGGAPGGFAALAGDGRIDLRWETVSGEGLRGYRLYRRTAAESAFTPLTAVLAPQVGTYADLGLLNGLEHHYRIHFVFEEGERDPPAEDVATPGRVRPWVVDAGQGKLLRLTPDGRRVVGEHAGFSAPTAVAVDSARGLVWVSDPFSGRVSVLDPASGVTVTIPGLAVPGTLAVDPLRRLAHVCEEGADAVQAFDPSGTPVGAPIEPLQLPIGIAVDHRDRSVWICQRAGDRVSRHLGDSLLWSVAVEKPSRVAMDSVGHRAWVTSFEGGRVVRIAPSGAVDLTVPFRFAGPIGIAVDDRRDRVWVADALASEVVVLNRLGGGVLFRVPAMAEVRDLALDLDSGEAWAVLPAAGQVVRLSPSGQVLMRLSDLGEPFGIALDPGPRPDPQPDQKLKPMRN